jgi:hypothetical protein
MTQEFVKFVLCVMRELAGDCTTTACDAGKVRCTYQWRTPTTCTFPFSMSWLLNISHAFTVVLSVGYKGIRRRISSTQTRENSAGILIRTPGMHVQDNLPLSSFSFT